MKSGIRKNTDTVIAKEEDGILIPIYTPPQGEQKLRNYLHNLDEYINNSNDDIHPLIKAGIIHYQFECIHPFIDGNGRTGRILILLYLISTNKLEYPILFLSKYINKNKKEYYEIFQKTHASNNPNDMIIFILKGIKTQALQTSLSIQKIQNLILSWENNVTKTKMKIPLAIMKFLGSNPFVNITMTAKHLGIARQTAATYLKEMADEKCNILKHIKVGREMLYYSPEFIKLLS